MKKKPVLYAVIGVAVMLFAGFIYAWSILSAPIHAEFPQWSSAQLSLTFTICMTFFCLGGIGAGLISRRLPVRVNVILAGALFFIGFYIAAQAYTLPALYLGYGVLCGTASGFAYNSVMNLIPRWFPKRQGLISGVLLMGFGASSLIVGSVFTAVTPDTVGAWRDSLFYMGILMAIVLIAGSFFFVEPKNAEGIASKNAAGTGDLDITPSKMVRQGSFWLFFGWATLISAVGLVIIAQARSMVQTVAPSFDAGALSLVVGIISVCNGLGRVLFGGLFDRIGYKSTTRMVTIAGLIGAGLLMLAVLLKNPALLITAFLFVGLSFGGGPTMGAAFTKLFYGQKNYAVNFPIMNVSLLVASFASTAAGAIYDANGSYPLILALLLGLISIALLLQICLCKLRQG